MEDRTFYQDEKARMAFQNEHVIESMHRLAKVVSLIHEIRSKSGYPFDLILYGEFALNAELFQGNVNFSLEIIIRKPKKWWHRWIRNEEIIYYYRNGMLGQVSRIRNTEDVLLVETLLEPMLDILEEDRAKQSVNDEYVEELVKL